MKIEDLISKLPPMKTGAELTKALADIPPYYEDVRNADTTTRLMGLSELYNIYIPSSMSHEIYSKLYLAMIRSLQKKCSQQAILQRYENNAAIIGQEYRGIIGGADSFTIIGASGIGKSSAIGRAVSLITQNTIIPRKFLTSKPLTSIFLTNLLLKASKASSTYTRLCWVLWVAE